MGNGVMTKEKIPEVRAVDIFCGVGGLSFGLKKAGLKMVAGVDLDPMCQFPFEANCEAEFLHQDVKRLHGIDLEKRYGTGSIRVLAGCAPCQPFSTYSQSRKSRDDRWMLLREFLRLATEVRPEIITMENVTRLALTPVWKEFVLVLKGEGYFVSWGTIRCDSIGVPQARQRLVLLASMKPGLLIDDIQKTGKRNTVRNVIGQLPPVAAGGVDPHDQLHRASRLSAMNLRRVRASHAGGTWRDWGKDLRADCHKKKTGETYPSVYGRMAWDAPAPTITTQFYGFGNGRFGHPEQDRAITIREAAMLQSFPKSYQFVKGEADISFRRLGILIGNAVPPQLGRAIGAAIMRHATSAYAVSSR